jgi:NAD(P)-dependent dehydrogenase (short-subunit alcohol dehydrogenase family)
MNAAKERTALITGASRGLGRALGAALAARGWNLIVTARDAAALQAVQAEESNRTGIVAVSGDVADADHRTLVREAVQEAGGVDLVVNNASLLGPTPLPPLLDYPIDQLEEVYRVNVFAPLALLQTVKDLLKPNARIVNVSSDAGVEAYEGWGGYGSSKAALEQLSAVLAAENPEWRVYWVDPGDMRTQMQQDAFPGEDISDRPLPEESVPGLLELIEGSLPSGRYQAREIEVPEKARQA